jgi:hypothetical protein
MTIDIQEEVKIFNHYRGLFFSESEIKNSLHQQVMSTFRPKRFPVFQSDEWFKFIPLTQLEKIIYKNLAKHRSQPEEGVKEEKVRLFSNAPSIKFKRG